MTLTYLPARLGRTYAAVELQLPDVECLRAALDFDGTGVNLLVEGVRRAEVVRELEQFGKDSISHLVLARRRLPHAELTITRTGVLLTVDEDAPAPAELYRAEREICGVLSALRAPALNAWRHRCYRLIAQLNTASIIAVLPTGVITAASWARHEQAILMWALLVIWGILAASILVTHHALKMPLPPPVRVRDAGARPASRWHRFIEEIDMLVTAFTVLSPAALWFWSLLS